MWSDPKIIIPLIAASLTALGILINFIIQYHGNENFREKIDKTISKFKVTLAQNFFFMVYLPFFVICLLILYWLNYLSLNAFLLMYGLWITIWALYLKKRRKNISLIASCRLGVAPSEQGDNGLLYIRHEDGDAVKEVFEGEVVRRTNAANPHRQYYIYFAFREDVVKYFRNAQRVLIVVEFFDFALDNYKDHSFNIEYDSKDTSYSNPKFKRPDDFFPYKGTNTWQLALFEIKDGRFERRQQDKADFRIRCKSGSLTDSNDLYVRRVLAIALNEQ